MGPTATKLRKLLGSAKAEKIIHIEALYAARDRADKDAQSIRNPDDFGAELHLFLAVYASVQNYIAVLSEHLTAMKELSHYAGIVEKSKDTYLPGFPPLSPITDTFFSFWALFDVRFGIGHETMGSCIIDIGGVLEIGPGTIDLARNLSTSRMGVYHHCGTDGENAIILEEIFTGK